MDKQQGLLYSTGNYIQYPVINHRKNGNEYEKVCVTSFEQFTTESLWVCSFLCARFYVSIIDSVSLID